jgi:hypothetical protein
MLTGMTSISLHMQWPLTSQSQVSSLKENNWFFVTDQTPCPFFDKINTYLTSAHYILYLIFKKRSKVIKSPNALAKIRPIWSPWHVSQSAKWNGCCCCTVQGQSSFQTKRFFLLIPNSGRFSTTWVCPQGKVCPRSECSPL